MNRPTKEEIVPGLLLASARWSDVEVLGWTNKSRGLVRCAVFAPEGQRVVTLPMQSLRWQ